jgi:DNA-binding SARP family transcriptional activator
MLGGFNIEAGAASIRDSSMRTHQLWHLIEYLIAFRKKTISQDELINILWPDGDIDNPANALKNLVYRIRSTFTAHSLPRAKDMIVYNRGTYQWNNSLDCTIDAEEFEEHCKQASDISKPGEVRLSHYRKALELYRGDFLPASQYEAWVIPIASYYRALYFEGLHSATELLMALERFEEVEALARKGLEVDRFEEKTNMSYMNALIHQGKQAEALAHYNQITDLFFRELGVTPSPAMRTLYMDIAKTVHNIEADIEIIKGELREPIISKGAFYCEYEVFKNLYRLEARTSARSGQSVFICLITALNEKTGETLETKTRGKVMDGLHTVIRQSLRKGDVYSRFSASQYVLMLPGLTYENCEMVMSRIHKRYKQSFRVKGVSIQTRIQPLEPVDML